MSWGVQKQRFYVEGIQNSWFSASPKQKDQQQRKCCPHGFKKRENGAKNALRPKECDMRFDTVFTMLRGRQSLQNWPKSCPKALQKHTQKEIHPKVTKNAPKTAP